MRTAEAGVTVTWASVMYWGSSMPSVKAHTEVVVLVVTEGVEVELGVVVVVFTVVVT